MSKLFLHPSCSDPARKENVEYRLLPSFSLATATQFLVHSSPKFSARPTKFFSLKRCINRPSLRSAYHQNKLPATPERVRYDFFTFSGSVLSRKNDNRGGDDNTTLCTLAVNGAVPSTELWATSRAIGEQPPLATTVHCPMGWPLLSLLAS